MITKNHKLDPMLKPKSIVLVGGSPKVRSVGNLMIRTLNKGAFKGDKFIVNPRYKEVEKIKSFSSLSDLPFAPDLAVISLASHRIENAVQEAIKIGVKSLVIFDFCLLENDTKPFLLERLKSITKEANISVCGGNGMGFFNYNSNTFVSFQEPTSIVPGYITAICHSGSVFAMLADAAGHYGFNLITAQGQEINASIADYMSFAIEQTHTRVIVLFAEAIRDPENFICALEKAQRKKIPVVVTKVGINEKSAALAATHTGAIVGSDTAFDAVCKKYGVLRTDDLDSLMATAQILSMNKKIGPGGLGVILDSGGLREQLLDLNDEFSIPFANLAKKTEERLKKTLYFGLEPINPLDAAGPYNEDLGKTIENCLEILDDDPEIALLVHEYFSTDTTPGVPEISQAAVNMQLKSKKPYLLSYALGSVNNINFVKKMRLNGVTVINGTKPLLVGVKLAFEFRDFIRPNLENLETIEEKTLNKWKNYFHSVSQPSAKDVLNLLNNFGVNSVTSIECNSLEKLKEASKNIGFPVVLKTSVKGVYHKSDIGGVFLDIKDQIQLLDAFQRLSLIGPEMLISEMVDPGIEIAFGMVNDPQYGPVVMVSAGGILVEILNDRSYALAPFDAENAVNMLKTLKIWKLLIGARGYKRSNIDELAKSLSRFSVLCHELRHIISEIDVNPIIVGQKNVIAVDGLCVKSN